MRKLLCLILAACLAASLMACGGTANTPTTPPPTAAPTAPPDPTEPPPPPVNVWQKTDELPVSGQWHLGCDVTVTAAFTLEGNLELELNGFTITREVSVEDVAEQHIYTVPENVTLTVTDSSQAGTGGCKAVYAQDAKCMSPGALVQGMAGSVIALTGGTYDASGVESVYVTTFGGAIYTDGQLTLNKVTVLGYKNTAPTNDGGGTAIGGGEASQIEIDGGNYVGGGTTGNGAVIASKGQLTIDRGVFGLDPALFGRAAQDGSVIYMAMNEEKTSSLTINGGAFTGVKVYGRGGVICAQCPVTVTGGEFYGAEASQGGVICATDTLDISGGYFFGVGKLHLGDGGLIYATGDSMTITGGQFKQGGANNEGTNIYYSKATGTVTLGGKAHITGGVTIRSTKGNAITLMLKDQVVVDNTDAKPKSPWNLRLEYVMIYLNDSTDQAGVADKGNTDITLTHDSEGNVTGFTRS